MKRNNIVRKLICVLALDICSGFTIPPASSRAVCARSRTFGGPLVTLTAEKSKDDSNNSKNPKKKPKGGPGRKRKKSDPSQSKKQSEANKKKLVQEIGERMRDTTNPASSAKSDESNLLDKLNPFKAGQKLRQSIDTAITSISPEAAVDKNRAMYYLDDRLVDGSPNRAGGANLNERTLSERLDQDDYIPEVLVVGATGEVGRLVVRRLLQQGNCKVRVLVRDLYTKTLNMLGAGVTYCQGDLGNMDSLEYALTDVDKIVFCASAPRPDEDQFQTKFKEFLQENLEPEQQSESDAESTSPSSEALFDDQANDVEWEQLEAVLQVRAKLAEQVDMVGMQNLLRSYQNVRYADYGTSQAAKRSLFKFSSRPEDFSLFALDEGVDDDDDESVTDSGSNRIPDYTDYTYSPDEEPDEDDEFEDIYEDDYDDYEYGSEDVEQRSGASIQTQVQWIRNKFGRAVFVGRLPKATSGNQGGEASVVSSRLRSRDDPQNGIDISNGFGGFVVRACSDGGKYEAFIRTRSYYEDGIEYVCEFTTGTKTTGRNKSKNKYVTVRLPFDRFVPVQTRSDKRDTSSSIPPFRGGDVRNMGFRYRSASNELKTQLEGQELSNFYVALAYIKLYRVQPEPEFVYLSDARVPQVVTSNMVSHSSRQLIPATGSNDGGVTLLDDSLAETVTNDKVGRSPEETYYKFRGEEALKMSGLSYAIVRVMGYNENPSGEASTIDLNSSSGDVGAVSRDEVAQVVVNALMDPNALNKSFYMGKKSKATSEDENISTKFEQLPADLVV